MHTTHAQHTACICIALTNFLESMFTALKKNLRCKYNKVKVCTTVSLISSFP